MQVTPKVSCVTRVGGTPVSLTRGVAVDLPKDVADRLVKAGHCARVAEEPSPQAQSDKTEADKAPAKPKPSGKSAGPAPENKGA